jgi:mannitol-1-phosphate/altronate dehydrogenase
MISSRTYAGFGLGAIQSGLFLYEAFQTKAYHRLVIAEVIPEVVSSVRANGGTITVNIAFSQGIQSARIGPIEIYNPFVEADRKAMIQAVAEADEIGTAVPGTQFYTSSGPESLAKILAAGLQAKILRGGPGALIYTAENNNRAAEILEERVLAEIPAAQHPSITSATRFLNTVIGKMSGVLRGYGDMQALGLIPITPGSDRAFLVEAFNHILISTIAAGEGNNSPYTFSRGLTTFIEKDDLLPFEEAKLYGHNATHALAGVQRIADLSSQALPGAADFLRQAFVTESGAALIHRYSGVDPLFTQVGYTEYADDLLARMFSPWLNDTIERVGRDVERKLGWDDRLVGTVRLCLAEGVTPRRYALGTAAAIATLDPSYLTNTADPADCLLRIWGQGSDPREPHPEVEQENVLALIRDGMLALRQWISNHPDRAPQYLFV